MNEGELKKRFREQSGEQTERGVVVAGWAPRGETVMSWIDEAKKEFPTCNACEYGGYACNLKDPDSDFCPKMVWFEKWFGE